MTRLQTYFDELVIGETQFSWYEEYLADDKVDSDIASFGLRNPKPACPRSNIMGEVRQEQQRLLRLQVILASASEEQARLIGFDCLFNGGTLIIHMAHLDQCTID